MDPVTTIDPAASGETSAPATSRLPARVLGAALGAVAGLVAIGGLFILARVSGWSEWVGLALLVGEDGVFSPTSGAPLAWAVPPVAAAIVGAVTAPAAARGVRWSGWWMGYLTYGLGILFGALVLVLIPTAALETSSDFPVDPLTYVVGLLTLAFVGTIIAAPLLILCVAAGIGWAAIVRRLAPVGDRGDPGSRPIIVMGVLAGILAVLWLMVTTFLDILVQTQVSGD